MLISRDCPPGELLRAVGPALLQHCTPPAPIAAQHGALAFVAAALTDRAAARGAGGCFSALPDALAQALPGFMAALCCAEGAVFQPGGPDRSQTLSSPTVPAAALLRDILVLLRICPQLLPPFLKELVRLCREAAAALPGSERVAAVGDGGAAGDVGAGGLGSLPQAGADAGAAAGDGEATGLDSLPPAAAGDDAAGGAGTPGDGEGLLPRALRRASEAARLVLEEGSLREVLLGEEVLVRQCAQDFRCVLDLQTAVYLLPTFTAKLVV